MAQTAQNGLRLLNNKKKPGKSKKRVVSPVPTQSELRRMAKRSQLANNKSACSIMFAYATKNIGWEEAYYSLKKVGFNTFGYRRGYVQ